MAHTFKTDPDWIKEARHPYQLAHTTHRRGLSKRIRASERREMDRILRDMEASDTTLQELTTRWAVA